ncbi:unnamed protein product [Symbiodinium necroappetens]|uniref:PDZ domain-containing protein n=1 Tax=Symbiodinium necroappetens TaxID=1628268 RepID=A0A812XBA4_9DINO|nr:unnamed protein product [Symbiodinium necroappetens]
MKPRARSARPHCRHPSKCLGALFACLAVLPHGHQNLVGARSPLAISRWRSLLPRQSQASGEALWQEALQAERSRSELLLGKFEDLEGLGAADDAQDRRSSLKEELSGLLKEELPKTQAAFEKLKGYNDELDEALQLLQNPRRKTSAPSFVPTSGRLAGDPVTIDILPPVRETDGPALVPGAAHVRVSLPLKDNSELMWGSDLTPLYEPTGARLMCFTAFLPLGIRLVEVQRPLDVPRIDADLVVVLSVDPKSEAETLGIQVGDIVRAVSFVWAGPEPGWLDKMLGAEAMPMQQVMKCDGRSAAEVTEALESNRENLDGRLVLLLERPL